MIRLLAAPGRVRVCLDTDDRWVGWYRGDLWHYVCPLPCLVVSWPRRIPGVIIDEAFRAGDQP